MTRFIAPSIQTSAPGVFGSLTIPAPGGPYTNLLADGVTPTPAGVVWGKVWDFGGFDSNVMAAGAKLDGVTDDTAAFTATSTAVQSATHGGIVKVPGGNPILSSGLPAVSNRAWSLEGAGSAATLITYTGSGDVIRVAHTADSAATMAGSIKGVTIDGTSSSAGAVAFHVGDLNSFQFEDVVAQHFNKAGSAGWYFDNTAFWTEHILMLKAYSNDNSTGLRYAVTTSAFTSFGYHTYVDLKLNILSGQVGFDVQSGNPYNGSFNLSINVNGGIGNTATVWNIANGSSVTGGGTIRAEQTTGSGAFYRTIAAGGAYKVSGPLITDTLADNCAAGTIDAPQNTYDAKALGSNKTLTHNANTIILTSDALNVGTWDVQFTILLKTAASTAKLEFHIAVNTATATLVGAQAAQIAPPSAAVSYYTVVMRVIAKVTAAGTLSVSCTNNDAVNDATALSSTDGTAGFTQATGMMAVRTP